MADNTIDFGARKEERDYERMQRELSRLPDRDCDLRMEIWLDEKGEPDLSCLSFRKEEMTQGRIHTVMDAVYENLKSKRPHDNDCLLYVTYFTNEGRTVRCANPEICTDTRAWHAWRIMKVAFRDFWFLTSLAWRAWTNPIKSIPASAASRAAKKDGDRG